MKTCMAAKSGTIILQHKVKSQKEKRKGENTLHVCKEIIDQKNSIKKNNQALYPIHTHINAFFTQMETCHSFRIVQNLSHNV